MNEVFASLMDLSQKGTSGALCTIIKTKGSTPRREGSKMLVYPDGKIVGSIGGGEVKAELLRKQSIPCKRENRKFSPMTLSTQIKATREFAAVPWRYLLIP